MEEEKINLNGLKEAIKLLENRVIIKVEFNVEIEEIGKFKGKMRKYLPNVIRIDLERIEYCKDEEY